MFSVPFALSIHHFINSIGADVGFASIIAVALLVLLYFAHAREAASLRDRLDEAHTRIAGLEARIAQLLSTQAAQRASGPVPPPPGAVAPPATIAGVITQPRPAGSAIPSVRRIPTATATLVGAATNGSSPIAPLGVAAPALASATKVIPTAAYASPAPDPAPQAPDTTFIAPAFANGHEPTAPPSGDTRLAPARQVPAPPLPPPVPAPVSAAATLPPPVRIGAEESDRSRRRPPVSGSLLDEDFGSTRRSGRVLPLLISAVAVIVIVVGLILISSSGSGSPSTAVVQHSNTSTQTGASVTNQKAKPKPAPFDAAKVQVAVLNGTAIAGLAGDVSKVLSGHGYTAGNVTNAAVQTQATTVVYWVTGAHAAANKVDAEHVAASLSLPAASVQAAPSSVLQSCATGPTGNALGACTANAIVSVGSDRASLASSNAA